MSIDALRPGEESLPIPHSEIPLLDVSEKFGSIMERLTKEESLRDPILYDALSRHVAHHKMDLPEVLDAIARTGEMTGIQVRQVPSLDEAGNAIMVPDPCGIVLCGLANEEDASNFLREYISHRIVPSGRYRGAQPESLQAKDLNAIIWYRSLPRFLAVFTHEDERIKDIMFLIDTAQADDEQADRKPDRNSPRCEGSIDPALILSTIRSESIRQVKQLAGEISHEMKQAQRLFRENRQKALDLYTGLPDQEDV